MKAAPEKGMGEENCEGEKMVIYQETRWLIH